MSDLAYLLQKDINRLSHMERGDAYDIKAFEFPKMSELRYAYQIRPLDLPQKTFFYEYSKDEYINNLDSLHAPETNYIFSQRMIEILLSVKDFKHRKYPIKILRDIAIKFLKNPDGYKIPNPYEELDFFEKKSIRNDMFILQTIELLDVFDWEKSIYKQSELSKEVGTAGHVSEYVLKEPKGGLPPLFHISASPTLLFISREAREALKIAKIKGLAFGSLKNSWRSEVDVPIP